MFKMRAGSFLVACVFTISMFVSAPVFAVDEFEEEPGYDLTEPGYLDSDDVSDGLATAVPTAVPMAEPQKTAAPAAVVQPAQTAATGNEAVNMLKMLGIISDFPVENLNANMTRGEFAKYVLSLIHVSAAPAGKRVFRDVTSSTENADSIYTAYGMGLINGFGDQTFRPDGEITYVQAIKILVHLLGYDYVASMSGGYPSGYVAKASQLELTKGIEADYNAPVTYATIAALFANALDTELAQVVMFSDEKVEYKTIKGETILSEYWEILKDYGVLTNTAASDVAGGPVTGKGTAVIDNLLFYTGSVDVERYLGYTVDYYAQKDDSGDFTLLLVTPKKNRNEVLDVQAKDILSSTTKTDFYYFEDGGAGSQRHISIPSDIKVVYNGGYTDGYEAEDLKPQVGNVVLLDNNSDGTYEYVFINSYQTYAVKGVDMVEEVIEDQYGQPALRLSEVENYTVTDNEGNTVSLYELYDWDILLVGTNKLVYGQSIQDASYMKIVVSQQKISGSVSEYSAENGRIGVDGASFMLSEHFRQNVQLKMKGVFHLDAFGMVAAVEGPSDKATDFVYLVAAETKGGISKELQLRVFTYENEFKTLDCGEKINYTGYLNGAWVTKKRLKAEELVALLQTMPNQLVVCGTGSDGKVQEISFPNTDGVNNAFGYNPEYDFTLDLESTSLEVYTSNVGPNHRADGNTKVFVIPEDGTEEKYLAGNRNIILYHSGWSNYKIYNSSKARNIGALVVTLGGKNEISPATNMLRNSVMVVEQVTEGIDAEGNSTYRVRGYRDGGILSLTAAKEDLAASENGKDIYWASHVSRNAFKDLRFGDVFQYTTDANGKVDEMHVLFTNTPEALESETYIKYKVGADVGKNYASAILNTASGIVQNRQDDNLELRKPKEKDNRTFMIAPAKVYIVDSKKQKVRVGLQTDVQIGDYVFIRCDRTNVRDVVIYR